MIAIANQSVLSQSDAVEAIHLIRSGILPHVGGCDGLSILIARMPAEKGIELLAAREFSLREGVELVDWVRKIRKPVFAAAST